MKTSVHLQNRSLQGGGVSGRRVLTEPGVCWSAYLPMGKIMDELGDEEAELGSSAGQWEKVGLQEQKNWFGHWKYFPIIKMTKDPALPKTRECNRSFFWGGD